MSVLSCLCLYLSLRAKTVQCACSLAEPFIRVDVISFTHWPIIGSTFFHVCARKHIFHFTLYSHRSSCRGVPIAISSLSPSSVSIFSRFFVIFFCLFCYLVCLSIHLVRVIFHISLLEFSESSRCWLQGNANVSFVCSFAHSLTDLLTVSHDEMSAYMWREQLCDMPCCIKSSPNWAIARSNNKHFLFTVAGAGVLCIFLCILNGASVCVCKHERARLCALFFVCAIHQ